MKIKLFALAIMVTIGIQSCHTKDDINGPKITNSEIDSNFLRPAYLVLHELAGSNQSSNGRDVYLEQSLCTDECLYPARGGIWFDFEPFKQLFEHTWPANTREFNSIWRFGYNCVNVANQNILTANQFYPLSGYNISRIMIEPFPVQLHN
jgi:hypothetical protein